MVPSFVAPFILIARPAQNTSDASDAALRAVAAQDRNLIEWILIPVACLTALTLFVIFAAIVKARFRERRIRALDRKTAEATVVDVLEIISSPRSGAKSPSSIVRPNALARVKTKSISVAARERRMSSVAVDAAAVAVDDAATRTATEPTVHEQGLRSFRTFSVTGDGRTASIAESLTYDLATADANIAV